MRTLFVIHLLALVRPFQDDISIKMLQHKRETGAVNARDDFITRTQGLLTVFFLLSCFIPNITFDLGGPDDGE